MEKWIKRLQEDSDNYHFIIGFLEGYEETHNEEGKAYPEKTVDLIKTLREDGIIPKKVNK